MGCSYRVFFFCLSLWTICMIITAPTSLTKYTQIVQESFEPTTLHYVDQKKGKWAYSFVVASINPVKPTYRGFLYNIAVSAHILQLSGSQADVAVLLQMDPGYEKLPPEDERILQASNIHIQYLPPHSIEKSFFQVNLQKFATIQLTQYSRVLYLDSDIMPFCNMDYLFRLSEDGYLKENLILATWGEPANGGFWMAKPKEGDYERLHQVLTATALRTVEAGMFNHTTGWGHVMAQDNPDDVARMTSDRNTSVWHWYASNADQGLLYQWMKYEKQDVSLLIEDEVEHWGQVNNSLQLQGRIPHALDNFTCLPPGAHQEGHFAYSNKGFNGSAWVPYRDFRHFWSQLKPWNALKDSNMTLQEMIHNKTMGVESPWKATDADVFWWSMLKDVQQKHNWTKLPPIRMPGKQPRNATRVPTGHYYAATVMRHYLDSKNVSYIYKKPP